MMINDENKKSLKAKLRGRAIYLVLGVCVLAAGLLSYSAFLTPKLTGVKTAPSTTKPEYSTYVHINERVVPEVPKTTEAQPVTDATLETAAPPEETQAVFDDAADPVEEPVEAVQITYSLPLSAKTGKDYSMGIPVFSDTMQDWRTHNGVDFAGAQGEGVRAIAAGKVTKVTNDTLYGNTVTVDHGGGVVSSISGLADEGLIPEGAEISNETVIGVVGDLPIEHADGSHIHLEIRVNGVLQDPLEVMGYAEEQE